MMKKKIYLFVFLAIFFIFFLSLNSVLAVGTQIPSVNNVRTLISGNIGELLIDGETVKGTEVLIYIDGTFAGLADINFNSSADTNHYKFVLNKQLAEGQYTVMAVAEDLTSGVLSPISKIYQFSVQSLPAAPVQINNTDNIVKIEEKALPAPVLKNAVFNPVGKIGKPNFVGWSKNNLLIKVFIDGQFTWQFNVNNDISGTANFALNITKLLKPGQHSIYTQAVDKKGKVSRSSNSVYFTVAKSIKAGQSLKSVSTISKKPAVPKAAGISGQPKLQIKVKYYNNQKTQVKKPTVKQPATVQNVQKKTEEKSVSQPSKKNNEPNKNGVKTDKKIENNLQPNNGNKVETGIVDESTHKQTKLKLNLIIFIIFLLAVIGWIFWVNRELIKERKEENFQNEEKKPEDSQAEKKN
jgi:hypothetical protein